MNSFERSAEYLLGFEEGYLPYYRLVPKNVGRICTVHVTDDEGNVLSARVAITGTGRENRDKWVEVDRELPPALATVKFRGAGTHVRYWMLRGRVEVGK